MTIIRSFLLFVCYFAIVLPLTAQAGNPAQAGESSLREQYDAMIKASNRYQRFRVVDQRFLDAFMANVADSIAGYTDRIEELNAQIATQAAKIEDQASELTTRQQEIGALNEDKDSISLLGLQLSKATYSMLLWGLVGLLIVALVLALGRTRLAVSDSRRVQQAYDKTNAELEASRKSRLDVEQKLSRQLQDERNKRMK